VNTLAIRTAPRADRSFREYLQEVKEVVLQAHENQEYPFEELVESLKLQRNSSRHPLFDTMLTVQNITTNEIDSIEKTGDLTVQSLENGFKFVKFDLHIQASELKQNIVLDIEYRTDLFSKSSIYHFCGHFKRIVELITNSSIKIEEIDMITDKERNEVIKSNQYFCKFPTEATIVSIFEEQVRANPKAIALVFNNKELTYKELNDYANRYGKILIEGGVSSGSFVAFLLDRSFEMIIGILAVLKVGGTYVPIDPEYPLERIQYILEDSNCKVILSKEGLIASALDTSKYVKIEMDINQIEPHSTDLHVSLKSKDLAYVIYTSGTTGRPKGVMVEHRNVISLLKSDAALFHFTPNDIWTMFHSYCFDFSVWEIFGSLLYGAKLVIVPSKMTIDTSEFRNLLISEKVTVLNQTPTAFESLIREEVKPQVKELSSLRYVIFGGEALKPIILKDLLKKYKETQFINMYGITETTVHVTFKEITQKEVLNNTSNIGKHLPTLSTYIFNQDKRMVPKNVIGELYVGGAGVTRGYLNNPQLTRNRFIENPYVPGERLYRSGDLARRLENGDLEYCGRIDHQVKIRGYRIELNEIEIQLLKHDKIQQAVVLDRNGDNSEKVLVAYLVSSEEISIAELKSMLNQVLPQYMIPSYYVFLDKIPLTSNGKVDRQKLPGLESAAVVQEDYVAPKNEQQRKLSEIWSNVLGINKVGITDNYFELGGDSIKAIRLLSQINSQLKTSINVGDLYTNPTIKDLDKILRDSSTDKQDNHIKKEIMDYLNEMKLKYGSEQYEDVYPLSDIQQGMIYYSLKNEQEAVYLDQALLTLQDETFNFKNYQKALNELTRKHEILRTTFRFDTPVPLQNVLKEYRVELKLEDLTMYSEKEVKEYIEGFMNQDRTSPYVYSEKPLWRAKVFLIKKQEVKLFFNFHHAIIDGWSTATFITELLNLYKQINEGKKINQEPFLTNHKDYIIEELIAKADPKNKDFWVQELSGYQRYFVQEEKGPYLQKEFYLGNSLFNKVRKTASDMGIPVKVLTFSAYIFLLSKFTYENDVVVGLVENNRPISEDGDKIIGCFLNTVPIRVKFNNDWKWLNYLQIMKKKYYEVKEYGALSLAEIVKCVGVETSNDNPVFDVVFNFIDFHIFSEIDADVSDDIKSDGYGRTNTLMDFTVSTSQENISVIINSILPEKFIGKLAQCYEEILLSITDDPSQYLKEYSIVPKEDTLTIDSINQATLTEIYTEDILTLFNQKVLESPTHLAIVSENNSYSYSQLNVKANRLAHSLKTEGIGKEDLVGILSGPHSDMIVGILAVLKAGAAYLPIDPNYPVERINFMLADSRASALLIHPACQERYAFDGRVLDLTDTYEGYSEENLPLPEGEDLAYVIYTSGSTGTPKGVMVEHHSLVNLATWHQRAY
ncbi:amino acid adenylation domain-containing protein, partial [Peribacillus simplex]|uniref:amino acid adenylation domain-containing protein n=1 Tax=Peribacillus simplex TaxID=1478 RepID=UPI003D2E4E28